MNATTITSQAAFAAQLATFIMAEAKIPVMPVRMGGEEVIYDTPSDVQIKPLEPLVQPDGSCTDVNSLPPSFEDRRQSAQPGNRTDFFSEWSAVDSVVKSAHHQLIRLSTSGHTSEGLMKISKQHYARALLHKYDGERVAAADKMISSAVIMLNVERGKYNQRVAERLYDATRSLAIGGSHTRGAVVAEMAAFLLPECDYYSARAAELWLMSLSEYKDADTRRFRISRGIMGSHKFINRIVASELFEVSAALYSRTDQLAYSAFDYLRSANVLVRKNGIIDPDWRRVARALKNASDIFMKLDAMMEAREASMLAHIAGGFVVKP